MKTFSICKKINYTTETTETRLKVDQVCNYIQEQLKNQGYTETTQNDPNLDFVFSIGGDGTMLHTMRSSIKKKAVIVGVNAGNVGFLTPYSISDVFNSNVASLIENNVRVEKRSILVGKSKINEYAVNEYAITGLEANDVISFEIEIEHRGIISKAGSYRANALVVSGPCGSTAYNMNAGGAIIDPVVKCMQIVMVSPTILGARSMIISKNSTIKIKPKNACNIYIDGMFKQKIDPQDIFSIKLIPQEANILVPKDWNFFNTLSKKLHWNNGQAVS